MVGPETAARGSRVGREAISAIHLVEDIGFAE